MAHDAQDPDSGISRQCSKATKIGNDPQWRDIQVRYRLAHPSFENILAICPAPSRQQILRQVCFCAEFAAFSFNAGDKAFFRQINDHCPIPYRITETLTQPWHKVFLLVQVDLARCGWPNKLSSTARKDLHAERGRIYTVLEQVLRCLIDVLGQRLDGSGILAALDVLRSVKAGVWEGNDMELLQVQGIGPVKARKLTEAGIKTIRQLRALEFYHIERLLSRNPPFGQQLLHQLAGFPMLKLAVHLIEDPLLRRDDDCAESTVAKMPVMRISLYFENETTPAWDKRTPWTTLAVVGGDGRLLWFWRGSVKKLVGRKELLVRVDARSHEALQVVFACEAIVGTTQRATVLT